MSNQRPPIGPFPNLGQPAINPQQKKMIVHDQTLQLCAAWMQTGQDRPSIEEVQVFLNETSATIRKQLGWGD